MRNRVITHGELKEASEEETCIMGRHQQFQQSRPIAT